MARSKLHSINWSLHTWSTQVGLTVTVTHDLQILLNFHVWLNFPTRMWLWCMWRRVFSFPLSHHFPDLKQMGEDTCYLSYWGNPNRPNITSLGPLQIRKTAGVEEAEAHSPHVPHVWYRLVTAYSLPPPWKTFDRWTHIWFFLKRPQSSTKARAPAYSKTLSKTIKYFFLSCSSLISDNTVLNTVKYLPAICFITY